MQSDSEANIDMPATWINHPNQSLTYVSLLGYLLPYPANNRVIGGQSIQRVCSAQIPWFLIVSFFLASSALAWTMITLSCKPCHSGHTIQALSFDLLGVTKCHFFTGSRSCACVFPCPFIRIGKSEASWATICGYIMARAACIVLPSCHSSVAFTGPRAHLTDFSIEVFPLVGRD